MIFLWCINLIGSMGGSNVLSNGFGVFIIEFILIFIHFAFASKSIVNIVPAIFGGVAVTFSQGGKNAIPIIVTMVLGVWLALLSNEGKNFLTSDGHWKTRNRKGNRCNGWY